MKYLEGLNSRQTAAVLYTKGPLLIVAGAGAGKTRVITHRIFHLIKQGVPPEAILAITFTNKAAKEMKDRVHELISGNRTLSQEDGFDSSTNRYTLHANRFPWLGTFHALGVHILRENSHRLGLSKRFAIFDRGDSISAMREAIKESGLDPKSFEPGKILSAISREKGNMVRLDAFLERGNTGYFQEIVGSVWEKYEAILKREKALDFDDLLLKTAVLLDEEKSVREHYQKVWSYIHIDEYQDTNHAQYIIAKLLAKEHKNIAVVGDPDQNIYEWRGAAIKNILHFEKDYPSAKIVLLEENYRSTQTILAVANSVIKKNKRRKEKILFTKGVLGEKIGLFTAYDEAEEASFIAMRSKKLIAEGVSPSEIAVLFRANFQSRALEEAFLREEVPYQVLGVRFFERKEVKDILAYVRAALNPESMGDFRRIINVPPRGIGKVTLLKILAGKENGLPATMREKISAFRKLLDELKHRLSAVALSEAIKWIMAKSGLEAEFKKGGAEDEERLENIKELVTFATRYDHPPAGGVCSEMVDKFLTDVALQSDQDELKDEKVAVRLMTVHASKGLEFEYVFIAGLEEGLFPHERLNETQDESAEEEERRLFYVALTRAKKKIFLTYAGVRTIFGSRQVTMPSEFIFDIDEEFLQIEEATSGIVVDCG
ncbi:MAG: ATP-dependent DNA helicase PcrA [Parcubacteria group bacterium GW2011_GWA2_47_64]|nr:MAG: ATP-dependent DNA helicase PcrA [Parcubacteria group bacterium GW2011_GWA2_47_64]KKU96589.1 MAG: ATP-dependent DNA helicase PcrA [Parcubacteria group bacterium GW2011_GWC2_48_17]